jgi:hypothetical protein
MSKELSELENLKSRVAKKLRTRIDKKLDDKPFSTMFSQFAQATVQF